MSVVFLVLRTIYNTIIAILLMALTAGYLVA